MLSVDAVCWIACSWKSVTEITIRNTFKEVGFTVPTSAKSTSTKATFNNEIVAPENTCFDALGKLLTHLSIGENIMSADEFVVNVC